MASRDFYEILDVKRCATDEEISSNFKKLALKHHPLKNAQHMKIHQEKFHEICEAYQVLSNPYWKTVYDQYGEDLLRSGVKDSEGKQTNGYVYQQNCYQIFDDYFLRSNPFFDICDKSGKEVEGSLFGSAFGGVNQPKLPPMPTIEIGVPTTLKEFYNGCMKTVKYQKQTVALDGKTVHQTVTNKCVEVKPGMDVFNNFTFVGEGHQQPGRDPSNLYVHFEAIGPDPASDDFAVTSRYTRVKDDLFYRHKITLQDAIICKPVKIPLLDGRTILLSIDQAITPKTLKKIEGEGMKVFNKKDHMDEMPKSGDLYVTFEITFPKRMNNAQREKIAEIIGDSS